jgi:hypothetical protein
MADPFTLSSSSPRCEELGTPEARAAKRYVERVQQREEALAHFEHAARQANTQVEYEEKVRRQVERDRLRDPHPQSLEAAVAHLHDGKPAIYQGAREIWRPALDRGPISIEPWDEDKVNAYSPVLINNKVVMVPHHAIKEEHRFVVLVWDLDAKRNEAAGYGGPQQWRPMELIFRSGAHLENEQKEENGK